MKRLIISAPFGNYINHPKATSTLGTYTALERSGRWTQILKTVRPWFRAKAWINKIGLRNPGINNLRKDCENGKINPTDKILSIHGFDKAEWELLLKEATKIKPLALEINVSCPNVGHLTVPDLLFGQAMEAGVIGGFKVIAKLPPVSYRRTFDLAYKSGVRHFHLCNTLPSPGGGISGKPLKAVSLDVIEELKNRQEINVIGGGGITTNADISDYIRVGANRFAMGSMFFDPRAKSRLDSFSTTIETSFLAEEINPNQTI